jgi:SAM-dependent methyltransferase
MSHQPPPSPYRETFDCLWCGTPWTTRGPNDLEGWAQLCPACVGKAGDNPFLRGRLRRALAARVGASQATAAAAAARAHDGHAVAASAEPASGPSPADPPSAATSAAGTGVAAPPTRRPVAAAFPDDWFLRRGPFEQGAIHDAAWAAELDMATRWLDGLALHGTIVEPAAGVGFFSPLLAEAGELFALDPDAAALDRARERLTAHRLRAHLHVADPWAAPGTPPGPPDPGPADAVVAAFLLGRVRGAGLDVASERLRDRLAPGGRLVVLDLLPDPHGGPPPGYPWTWHEPGAIEASLRRAGLARVEVRTSGRFFVLGTAVR